MDKCTSHPYLFILFHKHIQNSRDIRKYHLEPSDISFYGVNITNKYVSVYTEESKSRKGYEKNGNCKRETSDNNKSSEGKASKQMEKTSKNKIKLTEAHAIDNSISSYFKYLPLPPPPLRKIPLNSW